MASIGLHPGIAVYSGFKAADAYLTYYPLAKKHEFAEMIRDELARSSELAHYFYDWGSRLYFFSAEQRFYYDNPLARYEQTLSPRYDYRLMRERGIRMILTRARLSHPRLSEAVHSSPPTSYEVFSYIIECGPD